VRTKLLDQTEREDPDQWWRASNGSGGFLERLTHQLSVASPRCGPGRPHPSVGAGVGAQARAGPDTEEVVMAKTKRGLSEAERRRAPCARSRAAAARGAGAVDVDGWQRCVRARALFHELRAAQLPAAGGAVP
jgi:hypothetical protein